MQAMLKVDSATALSQAMRLPRPLVFTNGVFDLLHAGHVRLLMQARQLGASLVVGVNSDASVRELCKGPERPLMPLLFHERDPSALIDNLRPELYVKGGDYTLDSLPEARQVLAWGGRAIVLPFLPGRSTTSLVQRIREGHAEQQAA
jgi:D-glycero-beta-D-manno-heptose 1-phosphate adenylyltransferase